MHISTPFSLAAKPLPLNIFESLPPPPLTFFWQYQPNEIRDKDNEIMRESYFFILEYNKTKSRFFDKQHFYKQHYAQILFEITVPGILSLKTSPPSSCMTFKKF